MNGMITTLRRPSPALVLAVVALIAALGGSAAAGGIVTKKKARKIADSEITRLAPLLSVAKSKVSDSSGVANRVGPLAAASIDFRAGSGAGRTTITIINGLILEGSCPSGNTLFEVSSTTPGSFHSAGVSDAGVPVTGSDFNLQPGEHQVVNDAAGTGEVGTLDFLTAGGAQVTMMFQTENDPGAGGGFTACSISGHAFST
jgi:hypothetical protein